MRVSPAAAAALCFLAAVSLAARPAAAAWCIARSGASSRELQAALDYACGPAGGADCAPIQASGLCYLPNTLPAHASYAFNSVFQRSKAAPGSCDFAGTATITLTDPSYGSCTYPASSSTAGGSSGTTPTTPTTPTFQSPPDTGGGGGGSGGLSPPGLDLNNSNTGAHHAASLLYLVLSSCIYIYLLCW